MWLHPFADAYGSGYQIVQSLYGIADGGILGSGIAQGHPDLVPYANSDFIIATAGELLGITGLMAMLVLYAILVARGLRHPSQVRDPFGRLLAFGLAFARGAAGLRRRRRRDPAHPAHRADDTVPLAGRLVARRQLGARRAAAAGQRHARRPVPSCRWARRSSRAATPAPSDAETQVIR